MKTGLRNLGTLLKVLARWTLGFSIVLQVKAALKDLEIPALVESKIKVPWSNSSDCSMEFTNVMELAGTLQEWYLKVHLRTQLVFSLALRPPIVMGECPSEASNIIEVFPGLIKIILFRFKHSKLSASPQSNLSGSSPPVGSVPKSFPPFQHPSHKLLEENGFKQQL